MERFVIQGGVPLVGEVRASGNKNAVLPLLAACLLTDEPVTLHNVPDIRDVHVMGDLLRSVGAEVDVLDAHTWRVRAANVHDATLDAALCRRLRASIVLAGPMVARTGELNLPPPGGDLIGRRPVDTHVLALRALGATVEYDRAADLLHIRSDGMRGADILLQEASVTGTENAVMAAVTALGDTVIRNAASEPHVQEVCRFLNRLGARIGGIGSNTLEIEGVVRLGGGEFTVGPDYLEVASFILAGVMTGGTVRVREAGPEYLEMARLAFRRLGIEWAVEGEDVVVPREQVLEIRSDLDGSIPEIRAQPWPGFPSDLMSLAIVAATRSRGSALFHDWMYEGRMYFTDKLKRMGAQIVLCDPHRCIVNGPAKLYGAEVESPDIRAGLALVLAALGAEGKSVIRNVGHIDRGYERIEEKLRGLGAQVERVV
ncbi:MAG TPA: UDP-N-acetylglucosamine 1-carboxyvinyltransferase [Anaerolineales bacterium]|nr:UDP-N-acetylglucosamine 1-carboxyvinyltransferase [Anaerolineales bacterium]